MNTVSNNNNMFSLNPRTSQLGFSLIEVMIAAFLLSFAILGIAGLQMIGSKGTHQSLMKQQAMGVVQNITERMRSNRTALAAYEFNSASVTCGGSLVNCSAQACTVAQIAQTDINNIVCGFGQSTSTAAIKASTNSPGIMVNGTLRVECLDAAGAVSPGNCASRDMRVTVGWTERELGKETVTPDSLVLTTRIAQ